MIRYSYAGRKNPRFVPDGQGVFHWTVRGSAGVINVLTHKRRYHNWYIYAGPYNSIFVWNNKGRFSGSVTTITTISGISVAKTGSISYRTINSPDTTVQAPITKSLGVTEITYLINGQPV